MRPLLAIAFKIASIFLFVTMMVLIKQLNEQVPIGQIIFFRALIGLFAVCAVYRLRGQFRQTFQFKSPASHVPWALAGGISMGSFFISLTLIPLPEATAIGFVMPVITVVLAWLMLGEKIRVFRWTAVVIGLIGVSIIIWPRLGSGADYQSAAAIGAFLALLAACFWALAQIFLRRLSATETSGSAVMSFSFATMLISAMSLPLGWIYPTPAQWGIIALCGASGGFGQLCVAEAMRHGEASTVAPFEYLLFPVSSIAAAVLFAEYPDANIWLGLPFVIAAGLIVIFREHQLGRMRRTQASL